MNIREEFFNGNISPENPGVDIDSEYWTSNLDAAELERKLMSRLKGKNQKLLTQFSNKKFHHTALAEHKFLDYGFRLGALMMIDLLCNSDEIA